MNRSEGEFRRVTPGAVPIVAYAPEPGAERFQVQPFFAGKIVHGESPLFVELHNIRISRRRASALCDFVTWIAALTLRWIVQPEWRRRNTIVLWALSSKACGTCLRANLLAV
jgi:hypothetical protein